MYWRSAMTSEVKTTGPTKSDQFATGDSEALDASFSTGVAEALGHSKTEKDMHKREKQAS